MTWVSLARFVHLDDALTLTASVAACLALQRRQWIAVGLLTGLAAASKPWGVVAVALVLAAPTWRSRVWAGSAAVAVVLLFWGPFLAADAGTLALGRVGVRVTPDSIPALFGASGVGVNGPLRIAQIGGGLAIAAILTLRGRWELALAAAFAWRLLLDPSPYSYYLAALTTAALMVDLSVLRLPLPMLSLGVVATWFAVNTSDSATVQGLLHLACFAGLLAVCLGLSLTLEREREGNTNTREHSAAIAAAPS